MLRSGILNPQLNHLISRVRHTNTLVIADRGLPFWPQVETIDLALVDDVPTVVEVLRAILANFVVGEAWMANEFRAHNSEAQVQLFEQLLPTVSYEPHADLKRRIPFAVGVVRTGDTVQFSNVILQSA